MWAGQGSSSVSTCTPASCICLATVASHSVLGHLGFTAYHKGETWIFDWSHKRFIWDFCSTQHAPPAVLSATICYLLYAIASKRRPSTVKVRDGNRRSAARCLTPILLGVAATLPRNMSATTENTLVEAIASASMWQSTGSRPCGSEHHESG